MTIKFYYIRNKENKPVITVCLLKIGNRISKGVAICSALDTPCKTTGRNIAQGRAHKAMAAEKSGLKMVRESVFSTWPYNIETTPLYKSDYAPFLTHFEFQLLRTPLTPIKKENLNVQVDDKTRLQIK